MFLESYTSLLIVGEIISDYLSLQNNNLMNDICIYIFLFINYQ